MITRPSRGGWLFPLVLCVLLVLSVVVAALQLLSVDTMRQARMAQELEDAFHRAESLLEMLSSRWKQEVQYQSTAPLSSPASGSEPGVWDSRPFVFGWERAPIDAARTQHRLVVWLRFTAEEPVRTFRFELRLRTPSALDPRVVDVLGAELEELNPLDDAARRASFDRPGPGVAAVARREAAVEVWTSRLSALAAQGRPAADLAALSAGSLDGAISAMEPVLAAHEAYRDEELAGRRVAGARETLAKANALPADERQPWVEMATFTLAGELARAAAGTASATARGMLTEAEGLLRELVARQPECCGASKAVWRLGQIIMRLRGDFNDPALLAAARARAVAAVRDVTDREPDAPIHRRTDIRRRELPEHIAKLWRTRVAASVQYKSGNCLIVSALDDGTRPVVHLEAPVLIRPLGWLADGSHIYAAAGNRRTAQTIWRVSLDGLEMQRLFPGKIPFGGLAAGPFEWANLIRLDESPTGGSFTATGIMATEGRPEERFTHSTAVVSADRCEALSFTSAGGFQLAEVTYHPTEDRLALLREKMVDTQAKTVALELATDPFGTPPTTRATEFNSPIGNVLGLSWRKFPEAEWIAWLEFQTGVPQVHFVDPRGPYPAQDNKVPSPIPSTADYRGPANDADAGSEWWSRRGALCVDPPGYVLLGMDRVHLVPLPAGADASTSWEPPAPGLSDLRWLNVPAWGRTAFFSARENGNQPSLFAFDLRTGRQIAILGPGSRFPGGSAADQPAISPIPEEPTP